MSAESFRAPAGDRFAVGDPYVGAEIGRAIDALHEESVLYLSSLDDDEFIARQGEFWSPADHVRHLRRSCRPVAQALVVPKAALGLRFGKARRESRDLDGVVATYHAALAAGGTADGSVYDPPPVEIDGAVESWRGGLIERWSSAVSDLTSAVERWSEDALDRYQLPHPLLGKMTVREILLFTVYHNAHHLRRVAERRGPKGTP